MKTNGKARNLAIGMGLVCAVLAGCSDGDKAPKKADKVAAAPQAAQEPVFGTDSPLNPKNRPLTHDLPAVGMGELSAYTDILTPLGPLRFYTAYKDWDESEAEVLSAVTDRIGSGIGRDNADLYTAGKGYLEAHDAFKKHDFAEQVIKLVEAEGNRVKQSRLVRIDSPAHLDSYNFDSKGFGISDCLFSDKEFYTDEESRSPQTMAKAPKTRCFMSTGMANYAVGVMGGSKISFPMADQDAARKIEAIKDSSHLVVYGYVGSVQRERLGGRLFLKRYVMVVPQRVDLVENKTGAVLLSKII